MSVRYLLPTILVMLVTGPQVLRGQNEEPRVPPARPSAAEITAAHEQQLQERSLAYYRVRVAAPRAAPTQRQTIATGEVIIGGAALTPPYVVNLLPAAITINGVALEPRCAYQGVLDRFTISRAQQAQSDVAQLIADKKTALRDELGDYAAVIPRLVEYARTFDLVKEARAEGNTVKVVFRSEQPGGPETEVGYICRDMRTGTPGAQRAVLDTLYARIIDCLNQGGCVFVPAEGTTRFAKGKTVQRLSAVIDKTYEPTTKLRDCKPVLELIKKCFEPPINDEEAAALLANWQRNLEREAAASASEDAQPSVR